MTAVGAMGHSWWRRNETEILFDWAMHFCSAIGLGGIGRSDVWHSQEGLHLRFVPVD